MRGMTVGLLLVVGVGIAPVATLAVEVLDTWNMTVEPVDGTFTIARQDDYFYADTAGRSIELPGRPYMALRSRRVEP